ncbi:MAG: amidohydrolase [Acidobacteria bacterium 13_1_40CM_4_65_8]|nr:MAG: amidohydrolase [Acidobacteria bacterium 13_1_40CM_4_65_8]
MLVVFLSVTHAATLWAQSAETVLVNGKIATLDRQSSVGQALAVRDGRIVAVGSAADIRRLTGPNTRVIDVGGRTVIPGLIDSHMHAIRAALSYATEVSWIGARSIPEAMARIREAAGDKPGAWLIVAGGWTEHQFKEARRPTQADLIAAAPDRLVYIQMMYGAALLTPAGFKALDISSDADVPPRGKIERDAGGNPTGWISGDMPTITALFSRLPTPTFEQKVDGTRRFFRELNRLALTGVIDPGGANLTPADYLPLFKVWQDRALTLRVVYSMFAQRRGTELEDFKNLVQLLPMGFGDDSLRFNGIGESVTAGMYNNDNPSEADTAQFYEVVKWAAERRMTVTVHWNNDRTVGHLLDVFERVNREMPIGPLRWSIAHLNDASVPTLQRMKTLGIGWTMQDALFFNGEQVQQLVGVDAGRRMPPIKSAMRMGIPIGAGTDAHRVMSYNPFAALKWLLDGKTIAGAAVRGPEETPTREEALRLYTLGSAWFAHDDDTRGSLTVGKLADLAVLSRDYLTVPVDEVGDIESLLTMVGGRIVYASGPFKEPS